MMLYVTRVLEFCWLAPALGKKIIDNSSKIISKQLSFTDLRLHFRTLPGAGCCQPPAGTPGKTHSPGAASVHSDVLGRLTRSHLGTLDTNWAPWQPRINPAKFKRTHTTESRTKRFTCNSKKMAVRKRQQLNSRVLSQ